MKNRIKIFRVVTVANCVPWHLANFIERAKHDYVVYVIGDNVSVHAQSYPQINFIDIPIARKINVLNDVKALFMLFYYCIKFRPTIIHSIMPKAGFLSAIASFCAAVPFRFHTFTGQVWYERKGLFRKMLQLMDKLIIVLNTACLTDSKSQSEYLLQNGIGTHGKPLNYLGKGSLGGINLLKFDKIHIQDEARLLAQELAIDKQNFVFAFIARKNYLKGIRELLAAFAVISQHYDFVKLLFIGPEDVEGVTDALLEKYPAAKKSIININKSVNNHESYLAISDVLCLPSYREGFGSIVIDAAAVGVPTIGTRVVGLVDAIEDGVTGLLIDARSVEQLINAMELLIKDKNLLLAISSQAEKRVREFFSADYIYALQMDYYQSYMCL